MILAVWQKKKYQSCASFYCRSCKPNVEKTEKDSRRGRV